MPDYPKTFLYKLSLLAALITIPLINIFFVGMGSYGEGINPVASVSLFLLLNIFFMGIDYPACRLVVLEQAYKRQCLLRYITSCLAFF
ncbi:hypothetical protein [Cronobacter muytjensii]|uniref:hypothetical protein n=1 Tax=Cronobacter muytjensii TaxID=413501 RepID=UPI000ACF31DF|nr:hypothetical protein [Cronobacter muytjensii]